MYLCIASHVMLFFLFLTLCVSVIYWFALLYYSFLKYVLFTILTYFIWYYLTRCCMISHLLLIQYITCFYVCKITFSYVICFWSYIELHILCCVISMFIVLYFCLVIASVIVCALYNFMLYVIVNCILYCFALGVSRCWRHEGSEAGNIWAAPICGTYPEMLILGELEGR